MIKENEKKSTNSKSAVFSNAILVGLLHAFGHDVTPFKDSNGKVQFVVYGDTNETLSKIYADTPIGSFTMLRSVKSIRSILFELKGPNNMHANKRSGK